MFYLSEDKTPEAISEAQKWYEWLNNAGFFSPMGIVGLIAVTILILFLTKPEVLARVRLILIGFFVAYKWARKEKVKRQFEYELSQKAKELSKNVGLELLPHEPQINWVNETTRESFIKDNKVVIKLSYHEDKNKTFTLACLGFVKKSLLDLSRQYIPDPVMESSSLLVTRRILEDYNSESLNFLHTEILVPLFEQNPTIRDKYNELVAIDNGALFFEMLLPELLEMGKRLYPRPQNTQVLNMEVEGLINFIHKLATREYEEEVPLELSSRFFSIGIVMFAKKETVGQRGLEPYRKSVEINMRRGYRNIYLLARSNTMKYAIKVAESFKGKSGVQAVIKREGKFYSHKHNPIKSVCIVIKMAATNNGEVESVS